MLKERYITQTQYQAADDWPFDIYHGLVFWTPSQTVEVKKGAVLCVLTAATPASMALVEVTDVGQTGTAAMRATSWKVAG